MKALDEIRERKFILRSDRTRLIAAVEAVLGLHVMAGDDDYNYCELDADTWPCDTVQAITSALEAQS